MSVRVQTAVWEHSEGKGNDLTVLLAIADNADDDGYAFPGYPYLAQKCRLSLRGVKYVVKRLLKTDELVLVAKGHRGKSNEYRVEVQTLHSKPRVVGVQTRADRVQTGADKVQPVAPEPSEEPSEPETVQRLFEFWCGVMSKNGGTQLTRERRDKVGKRLASGYDEEYIKQAVVNCARSDFHMGREQGKRRVHNDLVLICRTDTKLEEFHDMFPPEDGGAEAAWDRFLS